MKVLSLAKLLANPLKSIAASERNARVRLGVSSRVERGQYPDASGY